MKRPPPSLLIIATVVASLLCMGAPPPAAAQLDIEVSEDLYEFRLADGSEVIGYVTGVGEGIVRIVTVAGARIEVERYQIRSMRPARGRLVNGAFWGEDPNISRLFVGATGRTIARGQGYVAAHELFVPLVAYGLTDAITVAAGTPIIPEVIGRIWYVAPKLRVWSRSGMDLSVGAVAVASEETDFPGNAGLLYLTGTFGTADRAVSVGPAWLHELEAGDDETAGNTPVVMIGGEYRLGPSIKLISENYAGIAGTRRGGFLTGGVRIFGERLSADLGAGIGVGTGGAPVIPIVSVVYNFGRGR